MYNLRSRLIKTDDSEPNAQINGRRKKAKVSFLASPPSESSRQESEVQDNNAVNVHDDLLGVKVEDQNDIKVEDNDAVDVDDQTGNVKPEELDVDHIADQVSGENENDSIVIRDDDLIEESKRIPKKDDPVIYITYSSEIPVKGYSSLRVGDAFVSRHVRKRCLDEGYDLYEYKVPAGYRFYTKLAALFAPKHIIKEVQELKVATEAKRNKARISREESERKQAFKSFDKLFPRMPDDERESVFKRAFEKGSGRIGTKKEFTMDERINLATRAYVKYEYTDFESMWENGKEDLYEEFVEANPKYIDRELRNYGYHQFNIGKSELYEKLDAQVQPEIDEKIREWK